MPNEILVAFFVGIFEIAASSGFWAYWADEYEKSASNIQIAIDRRKQELKSQGLTADMKKNITKRNNRASGNSKRAARLFCKNS